MTIVYSKQIKSYFVVNAQGSKIFRSWSVGVCHDYINDNQG